MLGSFRNPSQSAKKVSNSSYLFYFLFFLVWFPRKEEKDRIFIFHLSRPTAALGSLEWSFMVYQRTIEICKDLEIEAFDVIFNKPNISYLNLLKWVHQEPPFGCQEMGGT